MNGLDIRLEEFKKLPKEEQMSLIFENTEVLKKKVGAYSFHQKILYSSIGVIFAILVFMAGKLL